MEEKTSDTFDEDFFLEMRNREDDPSELSDKIAPTRERTTFAEKLSLLLKIDGKVELAAKSVSPLEVMELVLSLGVWMRQGELFQKENPDVFENPKGLADSLGNILMIHRTPRNYQDHTKILARLGDILTNSAHKALHEAKMIRGYQEALDFPLWDDWDEVAASQEITARRTIRNLRIENARLDRRNQNLYFENDRLRRALDKEDRMALVDKETEPRDLHFHGEDYASQTLHSENVAGKSAARPLGPKSTNSDETQKNFSFDDETWDFRDPPPSNPPDSPLKKSLATRVVQGAGIPQQRKDQEIEENLQRIWDQAYLKLGLNVPPRLPGDNFLFGLQRP